MPTFEVIDMGFNKMLSAFRNADGTQLKTGILDDEAAEYGLVWEGRVSWLRGPWDANQSLIGSSVVRAQNDLVAGQSHIPEMEKLGATMVKKHKGVLESEGLEDTGALIDSIGFDIK